MKIIDFQSISNLDISYQDCVKWVEEALMIKKESNLPAKISLKLDGNIFFNTMPCYIPSLKKIGVKLVSRYPDRKPSLISEILLYDSESGELLTFMSGDWITTMRTGAVAALSIRTLQKKDSQNYSFVGLGNTARATLLCLLSIQPKVKHKVKLLAYKKQENIFIKRFKSFSNVTFEVVYNNEELLNQADVLVSSVTAFDEIFASEEKYGNGILLVPIHTRGFQNCDLFFDKIYGDDYNHIKDFKFFNSFKSFTELSEVLSDKSKGRSHSDEKIIAYNIGIALHDVYFASKILDMLNDKELEQINMKMSKEKFWI